MMCEYTERNKTMENQMEKEIYDSMSDSNLSPADFITLMFERTDEDGILYIPGWHYDRPGWLHNAPGSTDENNSYRCQVDWNLKKYEILLQRFDELYNAIKQIAPYWDELEETLKPEEVLKDKKLLDVWQKYVDRLGTQGFDLERLWDIDERWETEECVKSIAHDILNGKVLEDFEKNILLEDVDTKVTAQEKQYYNQYIEALRKAAEERVGNGLCAYDLVYRSRRLCRLLNLGAPEIIINHEARTFAAAMLLHKYGISREVVDNRIRMRLEVMEMMDEEQLDEMYRPRKMNGRKSLAPLFVYEILSKKSNSKKHLRQQDILKELEKYPYEISLERKAVGRIIQNLVDSQYGIYSDKTGIWKEKE